jgi:tetratricopeptide (TPR) repeat protein
LASLLACLLGMATKEVMVSAPLIVFLYDRTFVAGSFRGALRRRGGYYASLAATWVLLAWLVAGAGTRGGTAGFGLGVTPWSYALRQGETIVRYLGLSLWPHPLIIDYGANLATPAAAIVACALLVALLVAATGIALWRRPVAGFLGAWFFAILAPSSSVVPVATEFMAEHRMYLPLAAVIAAVVLGLHAWAGRRSLVVFALLAVALGWLTMRRNEDYHSDVALWTDAVTKRSANARAHSNLGSAWLLAGDPTAALAEEQEALRLQPDLAEAAFYAGKAALQLDREADAMRYYETTLKLEPDYTMAHVELGNLEMHAGRPTNACAHYEAALVKLPRFAPMHYNLAMARLQMGRLDEAIAEFETVLRLQPEMAAACYNLGTVFLQLGRLSQAQAQFERTLQLEPGNSAAHNNLANILMQAGRLAEAVDHYRAALRSDPANVAAHCNLGVALLQLHRLPEAKYEFEAALRLQPGYPPAQAALEQLNDAP